MDRGSKGKSYISIYIIIKDLLWIGGKESQGSGQGVRLGYQDFATDENGVRAKHGAWK
jgi:hypothetical protein